MKILLINNNPVVSRLTALSARKEEIEIDEIQEVTELSSDKYDIVFVDADSLSKDVQDVISENINTQKKVLFYAQDDKEENGSFDMTILKPFLPSEVSAVIRSVEEEKELLLSKNSESKEDANYDLFADKEEEKREELFNLDEDISDLSRIESIEIKENVLVEEESFDKKLEEAFPLKDIELDDNLFDTPKIEADDLFDLDLNDDKLSLDEDLLNEEPKKNEVSSDNELLDFDFENNDALDFSSKKIDISKDEVLDDELKREQNNQINTGNEEVTKILDASEIANIKNILEDDTNDSMELSDLMSTTAPEMVEPESSPLSSDVSLETLANLPVESLRKLLAGATVNISIKFPKD